MTPQETALLQSAGETFIRNASVMLLIAIAYIAIWILLGVVGVTFLMTTAYCAVYFQIFFGLLRVALIDNSSEPLSVRFALAGQSIAGVSIAQGWLGGICGFILLIGDAATTWRAWAISFEHRKPVYAVICLFLIGLGCSIGFNILNTPPPAFVFTGSALWILQLLGLIIPLITNVAATLLIGYQAYKYRGFVKATLGRPGRSKAGKIMMVLTESGVIYSIIQDQATRLWGQFSLFVSAMLPLVIILIVNHQRSIAETLRGSDIGGTAASTQFDAGTHISFAHGPPGSNVEVEEGSTDVPLSAPGSGHSPDMKTIA
ncbi:hypothetical protein C8J56DRAFT_901772 [Mycena floridula]|nr:hypothetical protein C8J56DRAFT_901772 [Mycena floridula]